MAENYSLVYMCHSFFIHWSADEHLGCFCSWAIINNSAINTGVHIFFSMNVLSFFRKKSTEVKSLDNEADPFLTLWRNSILFSIVSVPSYNPPIVQKGFLFFISLPTLAICRLIDDRHSDIGRSLKSRFQNFAILIFPWINIYNI